MSRLITFKAICNILSFSCLFFTYISTTPVMCSSNATDLEALVAIKNAIADDPQGAFISWNETHHFCSWKGIFCSKKHPGRVVRINLMSQGLVGPLSPYIGNLSFLRHISLRNNTFSGPIPNEIGRLRRFQIINFSNNSFSGQIPRNVSQCTNLVFLNFIDNHLTETVIPQLNYLLKLTDLLLTKNHLSGTIPPFIGNLTNLEQVSLAYCGFEGEIPESFDKLHSLVFLNVGHNNLTGRIPYGIYNISTLRFLTLGFNQFYGTIPSDIGLSLPILEDLHMNNNHFTGAIPASFSNSSFLRSIDLDYNNLTRNIIIDFTRLSALENFLLCCNNLEGNLKFISSMSNCTRLEAIELSDNLLIGTLPNSISNLSSQVNWINLGINQLHGTLPSSIGNLPGDLTLLSIAHNNLEGSIPSEIGKLNKLRVIHLGGNKLTNEIPLSFGNFTLLNELHLDNNNMYGNIPRSFSNCTNLLILSLSSNNLSGPIPAEVMKLSSISIDFDLSYNAFTGTIPLEVGSLVHLAHLDLSHNKLSGQIPDSLGRCIQLDQINLESNSFSGQIPDALRNLRGLEYLDLSQNNLSWHIPSFLGELNLLSLNLSFNILEGEVPTLGVFRNVSAVYLEGNRDLCGGNEILNLPSCPPTNSKKKHHFSRLPQILIPIGVVVMCIFLSICLFYILRYKKQVLANIGSPTHLATAVVLRLSYAALLEATERFSEDHLLGVGGFGSVYKGVLDEGQRIVAVKVIDLSTEGASKSFMSECTVLRDIRHRNLVKILSVCSSTDFQGNDFKALCYEFLANGNLDDWLHQKINEERQHTGERKNLSMRQRLSIVVDVACALEYLHCGTESIIVHGDLKPSNILLNENMTAHVGDFGLAKVLNKISGHNESSSIGIKGTLGYIPPEYDTSNKVSTEGDVYSYGILLMEIFTGRRPTDDTFENYSTLRDFVKSTSLSEGVKILDPLILLEQEYKMDGKFNEGVTSLFEVALACTVEVPKERILIGDIVNDLQKISNTFN